MRQILAERERETSSNEWRLKRHRLSCRRFYRRHASASSPSLLRFLASRFFTKIRIDVRVKAMRFFGKISYRIIPIRPSIICKARSTMAKMYKTAGWHISRHTADFVARNHAMRFQRIRKQQTMTTVMTRLFFVIAFGSGRFFDGSHCLLLLQRQS